MRVIFMGTPDYATTILDALVNDKDIEIVALFTQPDKPVGRKQILTPPHIKNYTLQNSLDFPIYQPISLKDETFYTIIKDLNPDFIVVAAYGQILPKNILDIAPCINLHASILPKYRGASPIQDAILNQEKYSGVCAMLMEEGLDSGDILALSYLNIEKLTVVELFNKLSILASTLTIKTLKNFKNIQPIKQNSSDKSYASKIKKEDGRIQLFDAKEVDSKYRAFIVWPGIFLQNGLKLKELTIESEVGSNKEGEILEIGKDFAVIGCKIGSLKIFMVQPESKKVMSIVDYLRGKRLSIGDYIV